MSNRLFTELPPGHQLALLDSLVDQGMLNEQYRTTQLGEDYIASAFSDEEDTRDVKPVALDPERLVTMNIRVTSENAVGLISEDVQDYESLRQRCETLKADLAKFGIPLEYSIEVASEEAQS